MKIIISELNRINTNLNLLDFSEKFNEYYKNKDEDKKQSIRNVIELQYIPDLKLKNKLIKKDYFRNGHSHSVMIMGYEFNKSKILFLKKYLKDIKNEDNKESDLPKWFPIGLGFATGEIQKKIGKKISARKIAIEYNLEKYHNCISSTKSNTIVDTKNIYSDWNKLKRVYDYCIANEIKICADFMKAYSLKLKEMN
ncbi:hypothetical protein ES044_13965 [Polaribacter sp. IC066]|uniref:hypothetical protein n=1 Tax=Polaribacter sp. IC066 TaxID=57032 RepID=UPI0011BEE6B0|nr:hypothetical protein [Polaribacter sp. IC066]TXD57803.1 hypothetical protein ES044_13965 [Polaribacter sp. IC066]